MNFTDTLKSVELVLATGEVPLVVGESGIGKTALVKKLSKQNSWSLVVIDGNLLKEGEIGGLPTIDTYIRINEYGDRVEEKTTVYAIHNKLREIDRKIENGETVLLFIDEINRCEHTVQQELMNLILNREINGYRLLDNVKIIAAMNPSGSTVDDFDYQVVDMDAAQENRFVWLYMESDATQWIEWAIDNDLDQKVIEFISTFPEYLNKVNEEDLRATPRSYERISKCYKVYKENMGSISKAVFKNVISGNVGKAIAQEFVSFVETEVKPLLTFEDVFGDDTLGDNILARVQDESHTRLYLSTKNILSELESRMLSEMLDATYYIDRLVSLLKIYPIDLMLGIMKDIKNNYSNVYKQAIENEGFIELYFNSYHYIRG